MSSDRMKTSYRRKLAQRNGGQMSLLADQAVPPALIVSRGRYVRFSWRYNTWQVNRHTADGRSEWRNISAHIARSYAAAGFPVGVTTGE